MQNLAIFDNIKQQNSQSEDFWSARDLQKALGYNKWENFEKVIEKAKKSFTTSPIKTYYDIKYHFLEVRKQLTFGNIIEAGVSPRGMTRIKASGNKVFFGGKTSRDMQKKLGTGSHPWADKASNVVLAGKTLANELTSADIRYKGISGAPAIEEANNGNNQAVRDTIHEQSGIYPEDFPPEEDTMKIERRVNNLRKLRSEQQ